MAKLRELGFGGATGPGVKELGFDGAT